MARPKSGLVWQVKGGRSHRVLQVGLWSIITSCRCELRLVGKVVDGPPTCKHCLRKEREFSP